MDFVLLYRIKHRISSDKITTMSKIENIANQNAENFIKKHFAKLNHKDRMVRVMKSSVKDTIKQALIAYELERIKG